MGNDEDTQIVSGITDDIRDAVTDYQVSGNRKLFLWSPYSDDPYR